MTVLCKVPDEQPRFGARKKQQTEEYTTKKISVPNNSIAHCINTDSQGYFSAIRVSETVMNRDCAQLTRGPENARTFIFPKTVKKAAGHSFYKISSLCNIILNGAIEVLDSFCFNRCPVKILSLPPSVKQIGKSVFEPCTTVCLPKMFYYPPNRLFSKSEVTKVLVPQDAVEIQDRLFDGCTTLTNVQFAFGNQLQRIGTSAFRKSSIRYFNLPQSVTEIGDMAFFMCKNLE